MAARPARRADARRLVPRHGGGVVGRRGADHRPARRLLVRAHRRVDLAVVRRPAHADHGRPRPRRGDARRHVRQDRRDGHRRGRRDGAVAVVARRADDRAAADHRGLVVHHRDVARRTTPPRRAPARGVARRQQLAVRAHRGGGRVRRHRGRHLVARRQPGRAGRQRRGRRGRRRHRRVGPHVRRDAPPLRRHRRRDPRARRRCSPSGGSSTSGPDMGVTVVVVALALVAGVRRVRRLGLAGRRAGPDRADRAAPAGTPLPARAVRPRQPPRLRAHGVVLRRRRRGARARPPPRHGRARLRPRRARRRGRRVGFRRTPARRRSRC